MAKPENKDFPTDIQSLNKNPKLATFGLKVEVVKELDPLKFNDNSGRAVEMKSFEAYLLDPDTKYPQKLSLYKKDALPSGEYIIQAELYENKGKLGTRLNYIPVK